MHFPLCPIPVIDYEALQMGSPSVVDALDKAAATYGCFYIQNHTIPSRTLQAIQSQYPSFFRQPMGYKQNIPSINAEGFIRGYLAQGQESGLAHFQERKEAFSYGYEHEHRYDNDNDSGRIVRLEGPNVWPSEINNVELKLQREMETEGDPFDPSAFQSVSINFYNHMSEVARGITEALSKTLGVNDLYTKYCQHGHKISIMRGFHYFPYDVNLVDQSQVIGSSPHTDWGFLTLIFPLEASTPGLQIYHDSQWQAVVPECSKQQKEDEELLFCNVGDYVAYLTKARYVSPIHRVITNESLLDRYSMVYFYYPNYDATIPMRSSSTSVCTTLATSSTGTDTDVDTGDTGIENTTCKIGNSEKQTLNHLFDSVTPIDPSMSFGQYIQSKWQQVQRK